MGGLKAGDLKTKGLIESLHKDNQAMHIHPEYIDQSIHDKQRIVILGDSDTTATLGAMVAHVLKYWNRSFGYITAFPGLTSVMEWQGIPMVLFQADVHAFCEWPSSASRFDHQPEFLAYNPHIAVITSLPNMAFEDAYEVEELMDAFNELANSLPKAGVLIYNADIPAIRQIGEKVRIDIKSIPYRAHVTKINNKKTYLATSGGDILVTNPNKVTLEAIAGAFSLLKEVAVKEKQFYEAISKFTD